MIKNIKLIFAYDGSKFSGMQSQKDKDSIQESLENAILKVTGKPSRLVVAGRTDAGVHAYGQVANFLTASNIPPKAYAYKLRLYLSDRIEIIESEEVGLNFHARFSAKSKTYRYLIYNDSFMHPSLKDIYCHVSYKLDIEKMKEGAKYLVGEHDFRAFSKYEDKKLNTVRRLDRVDISKEGKVITIEFEATSFLYNQVRIMVGSLVDVARGHRHPSYIKEIIDSKDRLKAGITYSPTGLYLMEIAY